MRFIRDILKDQADDYEARPVPEPEKVEALANAPEKPEQL